MSTHIDLSHSFKWLYSITLCEYHRNLFSYYRIMIRCKPFLFLPMLVRILAISSPTRVNVCACLCVPCLVERHKVPSPENVQISVDNQAYVLKWDYPYESTTFQAQWLRWVLFHKCPFCSWNCGGQNSKMPPKILICLWYKPLTMCNPFILSIEKNCEYSGCHSCDCYVKKVKEFCRYN